jgi:hypothetical protein
VSVLAPNELPYAILHDLSVINKASSVKAALWDSGVVVQVVSFGVGTKFMPQRAIEMDVAGVCVRDCHAEVLARRAFIRFLYHQLQSARAKHDPCCLKHSAISEGGSVVKHMGVEEESCSRGRETAASLQVLFPKPSLCRYS